MQIQTTISQNQVKQINYHTFCEQHQTIISQIQVKTQNRTHIFCATQNNYITIPGENTKLAYFVSNNIISKNKDKPQIIKHFVSYIKQVYHKIRTQQQNYHTLCEPQQTSQNQVKHNRITHFVRNSKQLNHTTRSKHKTFNYYVSNTKQLCHNPGQNTKQYILCEKQETSRLQNQVKSQNNLTLYEQQQTTTSLTRSNTKPSHTLWAATNNNITNHVKA